MNIPTVWGGDARDCPGGVCGGVERVEAAETFLEREVAVDNEAVDTFCRFLGGAIIFVDAARLMFGFNTGITTTCTILREIT